MSKPVAVKFLKSWRGYSAGEVAGFALEEAQRLVDGEVAEFFDKAKAKAAASAAAKAAKAAAAATAAGGAQADGQGGAGGDGNDNDNDKDDEGKP